MTSCSLDISGGDTQFGILVTSPEETFYTSQSQFEIQWMNNLAIDNDPKVGSYDVKIFNTSDCSRNENLTSPSSEKKTIRMETTVEVSNKKFTISELEDGESLSAKIYYNGNEETFESACSPPIIVDKQAPTDVSVSLPGTDLYITNTEYLVRILPSVDIGPSGLAEDSYSFILYDQPNCFGNVVDEIEQATPEFQLRGLLNDVFYSVAIQSHDKAGNSSNIVCSSYIEIDTDIPDITLTDPSSSDSFTRSPSVDVVVENADNGVTYCITENTTFIPVDDSTLCSGGAGPSGGWHTNLPPQINLSPGEGDKIVHIWVADSNGDLISERPGVEHINYDITPVANVTVAGVGGGEDTTIDQWLYSTNNPTVYINRSNSVDAYQYEVEITDLGAVTVCPQQTIFHPNDEVEFSECNLSNGTTYRVVLTSYDQALNLITVTYDFTVDLTAPTGFNITGVNGGLDLIVDNFIGVTLPRVYYTDAGGEDSYLVQILDGSQQVVCAEEQEAQNLVEHNYNASPGGTCSAFSSGQTYFVQVLARDNAGNVTEAFNQNFNFVADLDAPNVAINSSPDTLTTSTAPNFVFTPSDDISGLDSVECQLDLNGYSSCTSPISFVGLLEGGHQFEIRATDIVGNSFTSIFSWDVDLTDPVLSVDSQPLADTNNPNVSVGFSSTDAHGIQKHQCNFQSAGWLDCTNPWGENLSDGSYVLQIKSIDNVDLESPVATVAWNLDTIDPIINIISAPSGSRLDQLSETITFNTSDNTAVASNECQWNGSGYSSCTSPETQGGLTNGPQNFDLRTTDLAGNSVTQSVAWTLVEDTTPPVITVSAQPPAFTGNSTASISFNVTDDLNSVASIECQLNGGGYSACVSPYNLVGLGESAYSLQIRATDSGVHSNQAIETVSWVVDVTNPTLTIVSSPGNPDDNSLSQVFFSGADAFGINHYDCNFEGAGWSPCSSPWSSNLSDASYNLQVRATDNVGRDSLVQTASWTIDTVDPGMSFTNGAVSSATSSTSTGTASVPFTYGDNTAIGSVECQWNGGGYSPCTSPETQGGLGAGNNTLVVRVTDTAGNSITGTHTFSLTTHYWSAGSWGSCSASPSWSAWGACSASPSWGGWGACVGGTAVMDPWLACSATPVWDPWSACNGLGLQSRICRGTSGTQSRFGCATTPGTQSRSCNGTVGSETRTCSGTGGSRSRSVSCIRNTGSSTSSVGGGACGGAAPASSVGCSIGCSGSATRACTQSCAGASTQSCTPSCPGPYSQPCTEQCPGSFVQGCTP